LTPAANALAPISNPGSVTGASSMRAPPSAISRFASLPDFASPARTKSWVAVMPAAASAAATSTVGSSAPGGLGRLSRRAAVAKRS
jgi:hypothetical protein